MSTLFALGSNGSGQLGIGHKEDVSVPKQVLFYPETPESSVVKIAAGGNHTLLLTKDGCLYWSGDPSTGACGLTADAKPGFNGFQKLVPSKEPLGRLTTMIAATWEASIIVQQDEHGKATKMYSFGMGQKGELGQGEMLVRTPSATIFPDFPPEGTEIVDLSACMGHAVVVLSNGDVYGWGNGRKGQLGAPDAVVFVPRKIEGLDFKAIRAVCGREFTFLLGSPDSGSLQVLGSDKWTVKSGAPEKITEWKDVGASWGNIYALKIDGSLISWGRNDHGQLAPPQLPTITRISIGSEHVVAQSSEGDVMAWGWGEHGNCGPQVENNDVKGRWNIIASSKYIPPELKITGIGAGCATSWVNMGEEG
jgi:protein ATS1